MEQKLEHFQLYDIQNNIYNFAKACLFMAGAVLIIDYFSSKLIVAEEGYMPSWFKWVAGLFMMFLGVVVNAVPKPIFLLAIPLFFFFFGIWAIAIYLVVEFVIKSNLNVATISVLLIFLLKIILFIFFAIKWYAGYKTIDKLAKLKDKAEK